MEAVIGFFVFFVLAVLIVPLVMAITHASRLRAIEGTLMKLTERLKVLETGPHEAIPTRKRTRASSSTDSNTGRRSQACVASETAAGARQRATSASDTRP